MADRLQYPQPGDPLSIEKWGKPVTNASNAVIRASGGNGVDVAYTPAGLAISGSKEMRFSGPWVIARMKNEGETDIEPFHAVQIDQDSPAEAAYHQSKIILSCRIPEDHFFGRFGIALDYMYGQRSISVSELTSRASDTGRVVIAGVAVCKFPIDNPGEGERADTIQDSGELRMSRIGAARVLFHEDAHGIIYLGERNGEGGIGMQKDGQDDTDDVAEVVVFDASVDAEQNGFGIVNVSLP